jgi:hypothetical protein
VGMLFSKPGSGANFPGPLLTINIIGSISSNQTGLAFSTATSSGDYVTSSTPYGDGTARAYAMQRTGATLDLRVNGASLGTSISGQNDVSSPGAIVQIGSGFNGQILRLDGDVAEVLAVKGTLAAGDRTGLEGYLRTKYGL